MKLDIKPRKSDSSINPSALYFSYSASGREGMPHLDWPDRTQDHFSVPKISLEPLILIDPKKVLANLVSEKEKNGKGINTLLKGSADSIKKSGQNPTNRFIHGDSLFGMANLVAEGKGNSVQMIYFDPPFGIEYKAQFKSGSQKTEGYLDTWAEGLPSYLEYLRKRLVLCRELLTESGSIFLQIGDTNLHYVRCLLD